ncbi:MAG: MBL fold metallo-hydrolase [Deltaproteobacteria bacterium]|nr:MBL fold metallo-hydrolase [Deltaproteobacteria bacterium]
MVKEAKITPHGMQVGNLELIWAVNSKDFFFSNSLFIDDTEAMVVDPSANFSYLEHLASSKRVSQVLNTHFHIDHRSLNHLFKDARFLCHKKDLRALLSLDNYLKLAGKEKNNEYVLWLQKIFSALNLGQAHVDETLLDQQTLPLKDSEVRVVHLPGHTPGHIGLHFMDLDLLFVSDVDLTPLGPWYAGTTSNIDQFLASLQKIKTFHCRYYASSHGSRLYEPETFFEKLQRFEDAFRIRDEKLLEALQESPKSLEELAQIGIIYRKVWLKKDPLKQSFEKQMLEKHLQRLEKAGQVHWEEGQWNKA